MKDLINVFKALSDETRLRILKLLEHGELCVCDIVAAIDTIQPKISFHLSALKEAGLINDRKEGKWILCRLADSDIFRRYLIISILERIDNEIIQSDRKRLAEFLLKKQKKIINIDRARLVS